jgi:hypothetical protein
MAIQNRSSFQTEATGTFVRMEHGTHIRVTLGPNLLVVLLMLGWIGIPVSILASTLPAWLANPATSEPLGVVIPLTMAVGGIVVFAVGRRLATGEDASLLDFLQETLEAEQLPDEHS